MIQEKALRSIVDREIQALTLEQAREVLSRLTNYYITYDAGQFSFAWSKILQESEHIMNTKEVQA